MIDKDSLPLDKPRRTPDHPTKSHVVKTRVDGKEKIIRFGEQGASTAGKPKAGESDRMKQKRASFKARHAKNIAKGKSSPAYWANKVKWKTGGAVGLEALDEKYEGIKKPDFALLDSFKDLIRTLQSKAADAGEQEFDAVRALGRSGAGSSLEDLYETYTGETAPHAARAEAKGNVNPDRAKSAKMVFDSFKNAGFSDAQARALTAEINRENVFNPKYLYGTHTDAANRATNVGMLSWQGGRANRLLSFMADRGLVDAAGGILPGQDALNAQAEYLRWEMENDPSYAKTRETFLSNPDIDSATAHDILGKNFIRWRIDDPKYRGSGFERIGEGYDILNMAQGYKEGGKVKKDELAEAERLRDLQLMAEEQNPNAVAPRKPSIADLPGGISERLALINKYLNPVEAIGESMRAGSRLTSADASGYDRLAALGDMLSGVAGVAGPAAIAKRVGAPAATALMESLLGASPTSEAVADMARKYAVDEYGGVPVGRGAGLDVSRRDASNIFGEGSERVRYTDPRSGGTIEVVVRPDGSASVLELEVPEASRGQGIGQALQERVMQDFPVMGGQVSSKAAATTAYRLGRRPPGKPDATLEEVFADIDDMSSVNMVSPRMQERLAPSAPAANAAPFGKDWSDVYHWSRSPDDFSEFDLSQSKSAMSQLGPHVGTPQAAEARYMGFAKPEGVPPAMGFTLPMKADLSKPFMNPATGKPWTEMELEMFISDVADENGVERRLIAPIMRERLAKEGYTSIPYLNDVEDAGSVSNIMLADRPAGSDAVLRSRFAKFDPAMRASKNISAGAAVGAAGLGASQYDPDAIEARVSKAGKNEFAAGGAVKYDPAAVDSIINKLREVNRG
jgi:predicted GNAT family acetyltransferase